MRTKKLLMMIALLCTIVQGAWAESVTFNKRSWDESSKKVVTTETTKDATVLNSSDDWVPLGANDNQEDHYYVVKGNVSIKTLNCFGKVHLILCDNATLTCTGGIIVQKSNNTHLYIYSQSDGNNQGRLVVTNSYTGAAGIGCTQGEYAGTIEIHGGNIDATGAKLGAGIGAGRNSDAEESSSTGGTITIYGGTVKAQGGESGAGIGGGASNRHGYGGYIQISSGALFTLYGGTVTATGGDRAAGVGGGGGYAIIDARSMAGGNGGQCYVYGGTLTAQGGLRAAGIGSGSQPLDSHDMINDGTVHIEGGTVNATGGKYGAGIGGGCNSSGGTITIAGGTVTAIGGVDGAGIGGGEDGAGGTITISGGTVRAEGRSYGSGIGAGEFTGNYDENVTAHRGGGPNLTITGGTIIAIAGEDCEGREAEGGSAIGCGQGVPEKDASSRAGSLSLPDNYKVTGGDSESNIERVFTSDVREPACRWRNYVKIEACSHTTPTTGDDTSEAVTYTVDTDQHTMHCRYCAYTYSENHTFVEDVCNVCGKTDNNTSSDLWSITLHRASTAASASYADRVVMKVVKGQTFTIPAVSATEGLTLMGYTTSWTENMGIEMKDSETLTAAGTTVTPEGDMDYYPRYRYRYVPTWTWDNSDATATLSIQCSALSSEAVNVSNITYSTSEDVKTATGTYNHNGATYTFTDTYLLPVGDLKLHETTSNEDALNNYNGRKVASLTLQGRTLYADGSWNTLCLPFDLSQAEVQLQLNPSALKTLLSSAYDSQTSTLTLNFADAKTIEAGKPYLIKWTSGGNRTHPVFTNVIIDNTSEAVTTDYVDFAGFFSPVTLTANDKSVLYLGAGNTLYWPSADVTVGSCRAVFALNGLTADEKAKARAFVLNFGDESTGITTTNDTNDTNSDGAWFTLDGRKLSQKPSQHGIYIKNGKKVVIK